MNQPRRQVGRITAELAQELDSQAKILGTSRTELLEALARRALGMGPSPLRERPSFPPTTPDVPRWYPSRLSCFFECPERYRRIYLNGERDRAKKGVIAFVGSATHEGATRDHLHKQREEKGLPEKEVVDISVATYDEEVAEFPREVLDDKGQPANPKALATGRDKTAKCASHYSQEISPHIETPTAVQEVIVARLPSDVCERGIFELGGILDVATEGVVRDLKVGGRAWTQDRVNGSSQLTSYGFLYYARFGQWPEKFAIDSIVARIRTEPRSELLESQRTEADYSVLHQRIEVANSMVASGHFPPAAEGHWRCQEKYCEFFGDCRYVTSTRRGH